MISFEIRIPCYERPDLLARAIASLQGQSYTSWGALVYDDSRSREVEKLVGGLRDDRIKYVKNPDCLGAAQNIDQCFAPTPKLDGDYACLLEDDNYWLPEFLSVVAREITATPGRLMMVNQRINVEGNGLLPVSETTRGNWFSEGDVTLECLRASLFFIDGISNGGLVWPLDNSMDLRVGKNVHETGLHEACRSLLVRQSFRFINQAEAVWTSMPKHLTARATEHGRVINRGIQSIRDFLLDTGSHHTLIKFAMEHALRTDRMSVLSESLAYCGKFSCAARCGGTPLPRLLKFFIKGLALRASLSSPCSGFLDQVRSLE